MRKGGVADEGLAQKVERVTTMISTVRTGDGSASVPGSIMGTPAYMPPEQAMGRVEDLDESSDVFSLGGILCEILTGKPPYDGKTGAERHASAASAELDPAWMRLAKCGADEQLTELCRRCLQPLPNDRPSGAEELADTVAAYLTGAEGRAHRARVEAVEAARRVDEQKRARRFATVASGSVVLVLALAIGMFAWLDADQAARERERQAAIEVALQDAERMSAAEDWKGALAAAQRAIDLGDDGAMAHRVRDAAERARAAEAVREKDRQLFEKLQAIRGRHQISIVDNGATTERAYTQAFADAFESLAAAAPFLRASPNREVYAAVLTHWAYMRRTKRKLASWKEVVDVANEIAPEQASIRSAVLADDPDSLQAALDGYAAPIPPALVSEIGRVLLEHRPSEAIQFLKREFLRHPGDFWIHHRLAAAAWKAKDWDLALRHAVAATAVGPDLNAGWSILGVIRQDTGDYQGAVAAHRRALAIDPEDYISLNNLGISRKWTGDLEGAIECYRRVIEHASKFADGDTEDRTLLAAAYGNLATALKESGDLPGALAAARSAVKVSPRWAETHIGVGAVLHAAGKADAAVAAMHQAVSLDPDWGEAHGKYAVALLRQGDIEAALKHARRGVELEPNSAINHANLGLVLLKSYDLYTGEDVLRRAVALDPFFAKAWYNLGVTLLIRNEPRPARVALERAVALDPRDGAHRKMFAAALFRCGDRKGAVAEMEEAVERQPKNPDYRYALAEYRKDVGDYRGAVQAYRSATEVDPSYAPGIGRAGMLLSIRGDPHEAIKALRAAIELDPAAAGPWASLGMELHEVKRYDESIAAFRKALSLYPTCVTYASMSLPLVAKKDYEGALKACLEAVRLDPHCRLAHFELGNAYHLNGDDARSVAAYRRSLALDPSHNKARGNRAVLLKRLYGDALGATLKGAPPPRSADDLLGFAELCVRAKRPVDAARFYKLAFAADEAVEGPNCYAAACAAAMAGEEYHAQALTWLRSTLRWLDRQDPRVVIATLSHWKRADALIDVDPSVSDEASPEWQAAWTDADTLLRWARADLTRNTHQAAVDASKPK